MQAVRKEGISVQTDPTSRHGLLNPLNACLPMIKNAEQLFDFISRINLINTYR